MITTLQALKENRELVNKIDWSMTPEKAIDMYLEWGAGWCRGNEFVRGDDESYYFVIYDWENPAQATLLYRNTSTVKEIAKIPINKKFVESAKDEFGIKAGVGVYSLPQDLKAWLSQELSMSIAA